MNSESSKTSARHRLLLNLADKINLKRSDKYAALSNLSIYYKCKIFKISAQTWNEEFELPDGSYSVLDIQITLNMSLKNIRQLLIILQ